ncbi:MAG: hypothetical protein II312_00005, partial [Lachnospiraceae bacterium]|nr:hypothetical protein [Lachnospiraceae bacterium]
ECWHDSIGCGLLGTDCCKRDASVIPEKFIEQKYALVPKRSEGVTTILSYYFSRGIYDKIYNGSLAC